MTKMTFEEFCSFLDIREKTAANVTYTVDERKFLWSELEHKADDVKSAILEWVKSGNMTNLDIPEIIIPKGFLSHHDEVTAGKPISTSLLMSAKNMNYISAVLTIDWVRREPCKAMMVLFRGMI